MRTGLCEEPVASRAAEPGEIATPTPGHTNTDGRETARGQWEQEGGKKQNKLDLPRGPSHGRNS